MAGYERNPKLQRRLALLLAAAETLALTANFCIIFLGYGHYVLNVLGRGILGATGLFIVTVVLTAACLVVAVLECRRYLKGRLRMRTVLIIENGVLILLGVAWYLHSLASHCPQPPERWVGIGGLLLPLLTLFPLLWPLLVFKPMSEPPPAAAPPARPTLRMPPTPARPAP